MIIRFDDETELNHVLIKTILHLATLLDDRRRFIENPHYPFSVFFYIYIFFFLYFCFVFVFE